MITAYIKNLFGAGLYNPTLGKTARRLTFLGLVVLFITGAAAAYRDNLLGNPTATGIYALGISLIGLWISFRTVNFPSFADFLVQVETEMRKVSWPSKKELFSTTKVVMIFMAMFVLLIYIYDMVFSTFFTLLNLVFHA